MGRRTAGAVSAYDGRAANLHRALVCHKPRVRRAHTGGRLGGRRGARFGRAITSGGQRLGVGSVPFERRAHRLLLVALRLLAFRIVSRHLRRVCWRRRRVRVQSRVEADPLFDNGRKGLLKRSGVAQPTAQGVAQLTD